MKKYLLSLLFIVSLSLFLNGCSSISSTPSTTAKISFGGYYFTIPESPEFIGASASDALIITLNDHTEKAVFALNFYENFDDYNISAKAFLSVIYGDASTQDTRLNKLKQMLSKDEVSRYQIDQGDKLIYIMSYHVKEYAVIYNNARPELWVSVETTGMSMSELMESLEDI